MFPMEKLGTTIYSGVFTGNGLLGTMSYMKSNNTLRIDVGRTDVYDHRENPESALFDKARLPIGHFVLRLQDTVLRTNGLIDYGGGEAIATVVTAREHYSVRTLTFANRDVIYVEIDTKLGANTVPLLEWIPEVPRSPRMNFGHAKKPDNYPENPIGEHVKRNNYSVYKQPLLAGGGYATVWQSYVKENKTVYLISIGYDTGNRDYVAQAIDNIEALKEMALDKEILEHKAIWKSYYSRSNLTLPDTRLQQFYNMQLYKLASATGQDKPAMDLQGPWTSNTPWPAYWHNLNIELAYSPVFASNHLEIAESLIKMINRNVDNLIQNSPKPYRHNSAAIGRSSAPDMISPVWVERGRDGTAWEDGQKELGNLTWMLHSYYQYYRFSMNEKAYEPLFALLKRSVNYYLHLLDQDADGRYHIVEKTYSPEYSGGYAYDTNYDLSILRWGLKTLIAMDDERNLKDPLYTRWKTVLTHLRAYPTNKDGFMIAKDVPYAESHRHYSHLMMVYPFYDINWDQPENHDLIKRSISHWQSKPAALQGYSFSGSASMYAMMGEGDKALVALETLLRKYVKPNTLYAETGPVIETPLAAMSSIQELVLQHWNGVTRVFPAVPTVWADVTFRDMLTDGAFLISAERKSGKTREVRVMSQHTGTIRLKSGIVNPRITLSGHSAIRDQHDDYVELYLPKGEQAVLHLR